MPTIIRGHFFMPRFRSIMAFDGLLHWFEKTHGKHEKDEPEPAPDT